MPLAEVVERIDAVFPIEPLTRTSAPATTYRYLDGSTPETQRRKEVDAFQAGDGDCFLLSLKAGGTGLNLTGLKFLT